MIKHTPRRRLRGQFGASRREINLKTRRRFGCKGRKRGQFRARLAGAANWPNGAAFVFVSGRRPAQSKANCALLIRSSRRYEVQMVSPAAHVAPSASSSWRCSFQVSRLAATLFGGGGGGASAAHAPAGQTRRRSSAELRRLCARRRQSAHRAKALLLLSLRAAHAPKLTRRIGDGSRDAPKRTQRTRLGTFQLSTSTRAAAAPQRERAKTRQKQMHSAAAAANLTNIKTKLKHTHTHTHTTCPQASKTHLLPIRRSRRASE